MTERAEGAASVKEAGAGMPPLKWEEGLFEKITRGHQFTREWDTRYPAHGQTAADAPPRYITLFTDFFGEGNFRLPVTNFFGEILSFYNFHVSQLSPLVMVSIRHFEFACRSHGVEPTVDRLLIIPPKSYHDWKDPAPIPKEAFGEQVLVAAGMSDKWSSTSTNVPILLLNGIDLYHRIFPANVGVMGVRPLRDDEELWNGQIRENFMYAPANAFAVSPTANEGVHILNPKSCRAITPFGEEVVLFSSGESIASSGHGLNSLSYAFVGSLRELGIEPVSRKPKRPTKNKSVMVAEGARPKKPEAGVAAFDAASRKGMARPQQRILDNFVYVADFMEELYSIGGKFKTGRVDDTRSARSASSKDQPSYATPTSTPVDVLTLCLLCGTEVGVPKIQDHTFKIYAQRTFAFTH
ncbi:hypothetical protein Hanom_Chr09g00773731 [Helianthus anomalus]